ncbi:PIG-L family deacetylase [bacterium]|nr:PIG-L family deacetylase [bacterium]
MSLKQDRRQKPNIALFAICLLGLITRAEVTKVFPQGKLDALKDKGYLALYQAITDLKSNLTLMSVAAHPDDEDIETLTYYRRKHGLRTVVVNATRGEGGQNEIGPELYRDLGVIRTYEMERSGAISGSVYYNMNLREFGYSKSAAEAFEKWGHVEPLERLVFLIRKLRPDVIITNHDTTSGHGHHRATGILVRQAFDLAGDSTKFAAQLRQGVATWQPKRLFQRVTDEGEAEFSLPVGEFDPIRGESYALIAARALSEQRSQGMDFFANRINRGKRYRGFKTSKTFDHHVVEGPELTSGLPTVFEILSQALSESDLSTRATQLENARRNTIGRLLRGYKEVRRAARDELRLWLELLNQMKPASPLAATAKLEIQKLERVLYEALSLNFQLTVSDKRVVRGQPVTIQALLFNGGDTEILVKSVRLRPREDWLGGFSQLNKERHFVLAYNESDTVTFTMEIPDNAPYTIPKTKIFYDAYRWQPLISLAVVYEYDGLSLQAHTNVDIDIVPAIELSIAPDQNIIPVSQLGLERSFAVNLRNNTPRSMSGEVLLEWTKASDMSAFPTKAQNFAISREDERKTMRFQVALPQSLSLGEYQLMARSMLSTDAENTDTNQARSVIKVSNIETISGLRVGLVKSYDGTMENALGQMNIECTLLNSEDLQWGDLSQFDTIILDIRAYLVREDLRQNNGRVLEYAKNGGNLIVMYHKVFEWNPEFGNPSWAPFSLVLSRQRVTREESPVRVLLPEHPLLNIPNSITDADWNGWIHERGLYFPARWNVNYKSLLAMSDPEEPDHAGSYLVANYGKGTYIYTSLVWYRQLRALVPGAYRNLANMVAYAQSRENYLGRKR